MRGYKAFNNDLKCLDFQYEIGKTFEYDGEIEVCEKGFHFCDELPYCFEYYPADFSKTRIAEIEASGNIIRDIDEGHKFCTNKIKIIRELDIDEIFEKINVGSQNYGYGNKGAYNEGCFNSGRYNRGSYNNGDCNIGINNIGLNNIGRYNQGENNLGSYNIGQKNLGFLNKGNNCIGILCTEPQYIKMFNKESTWTYEDYVNSDMERIFQQCIEENYQLTTYNARKIIQLPNFDNEIFKEITGIDVMEILNNK